MNELGKRIDERTVSDFGAQWTRFPENEGWLGSVDCLQDHLGPLMAVDEFEDSTVADIGSGSGRTVNMLLDAVEESLLLPTDPAGRDSIQQRNNERSLLGASQSLRQGLEHCAAPA